MVADSMARRTFQHLSGVGPWREKSLWSEGVRRWGDFPTGTVTLSEKLDLAARARLAESEAALERLDLAALAAMFPVREHWRLYADFLEQAVFFDIEADGDQAPTVIGALDADGVHTFIRGHSLEHALQLLARRPLWVTFNGSVFDVPALERHFGAVPRPAAHVDLRFLAGRLKWKNGLKDIEEQLGLGRPPHLKGVHGMAAIELWRAYGAGDTAALRLLVEYNLYDAIHLRTLMDRAYNGLADVLVCDVPRLPVFDRGDVLYDVSRAALAVPAAPSSVSS